MYKQILKGLELEKMIAKAKSTFLNEFEKAFDIHKICSPIFIDSKTGLNDRLSGKEKPVVFNARDANLELSQSLAKWKREEIDKLALNFYQGIYTNMKAIRADEESESPFHSLYVEQFDWEIKIKKIDRNLNFLKETVEKIYQCFYLAKKKLNSQHSFLKNEFPKRLNFISAQELFDLYPDLDSKERENAYARKHKAFFIIGIGHKLSNGKPHDLRSADYDDWNLNGDLLVYSKIHDKAIELSSMGIRVDKKALEKQSQLWESKSGFNFNFHQKIRDDKLCFTIGGGIGQSRLVLVLLELYHIGEFQRSYWTKHHRQQILAEQKLELK